MKYMVGGGGVDSVVFSEFYFDKTKLIPAEHPIHYLWKHNVAIPKLKEMGFNVEIVRPEYDYKDLFYRVITKSKIMERNGKFRGFPIADRCQIKRDCKIRPLDKWAKNQGEYLTILGYAFDETHRLHQLCNKKRSILFENKITEKETFSICREYGLLSPRYDMVIRDGCWFCPNARLKEFASLKKDYPELWQELLELGKEKNTISDMFRFNRDIFQIDKELDIINSQISFF